MFCWCGGVPGGEDATCEDLVCLVSADVRAEIVSVWTKLSRLRLTSQSDRERVRPTRTRNPNIVQLQAVTECSPTTAPKLFALYVYPASSRASRHELSLLYIAHSFNLDVIALALRRVALEDEAR